VDDYYQTSLVGSNYMNFFWSGLGIRFDVPEGPQWSIDSATPLFNLFEQFQIYEYNGNELMHTIYHRPVTPYELKPMQSLHIKMFTRRTINQDNPLVGVTAIGRQKGGRV
jgi:hypothetical protein